MLKWLRRVGIMSNQKNVSKKKMMKAKGKEKNAKITENKLQKITKFLYKHLLITVLVIITLVSGFFYCRDNWNTWFKQSNKKIVSYARDYFDTYADIYNIDNYIVNIKMLKAAVTYKNASYDIEELNKCTDDSYVVFSYVRGDLSTL